MYPRSTGVIPAHSTAAHATDTDADMLQVCDDMTIEVALSLMAGARTGRLAVCDNDGLCTHLVTQLQLTAVRDSPAYTDRLQLRDVLGGGGPFTAPVTTTAEAEDASPGRRLAALPAVGDRAGAPGVLALTR
ncbi:hypothetical protein OG279_11930 [Streptomyces sp. NBC_01201]|uniref:CBS domain-containing protein n=2 Tax=Streptomyces TaxID=1883 RepID=A0ABY9JCP9_9ACTN|nr:MULTISPECIES: hypothetical protein [unclassified Streptomyces]WSQ77577.1 hypothetical protein OG725_10885 [Streptomyces sp. NBC_01213]WLQ64184.1 hypothetical protein P8A20_11540 [Streptomyces sp. Alt3]WSQ84937.1 hypothetical protein OG722_11495 [Streptomyces sp. NBC_01212]WSR08980.1 hypothetical protein OG265_24550 [Streptomyces sp. NBC_01208]WSR48290.1 hypothetical protein OG279_11930 [Streptomyces sp. NBC_01201]